MSSATAKIDHATWNIDLAETVQVKKPYLSYMVLGDLSYGLTNGGVPLKD